MIAVTRLCVDKLVQLFTFQHYQHFGVQALEPAKLPTCKVRFSGPTLAGSTSKH